VSNYSFGGFALDWGAGIGQDRLMPRQFRIEYEGAIYQVLSRGWKEEELRRRPKSDAAKMAVAARLRRETTLTLGEIAQRLHMGSR